MDSAQAASIAVGNLMAPTLATAAVTVATTVLPVDLATVLLYSSSEFRTRTFRFCSCGNVNLDLLLQKVAGRRGSQGAL